MADEYGERYKWFLEMRGIETPCPECQGVGSKMYGSTATWQGGIGGAMMTASVCDSCWGSGDKNRKWTNLRRIMSILTPEQRKALSQPEPENG